MPNFDSSAVLEACRRQFGARPRSFGWWERVSYLNTARPVWCTPADKLSIYFKGRSELLREGQVVWGCLIQANRLLFSPGTANCPGEVVYPQAADSEVDLSYLAGVAQTIGRLKGRPTAQPELDAIGDYLANERIRVFGMAVPQVLSPQVPCAVSSVFFDRKHLPGGVLRGGFFPLVVSPRDPRIAMVLPAKYWSPLLSDSWQGSPR